jgi:peptidoglycan-N-acetylglucosamine deacetylase
MKEVKNVLFAVIAIAVVASCNNSNTNTDGKDGANAIQKSKLQKIQEANPYIKISAKDSSGNEVDNGKFKLYLTFDDGPNPGTRVVIDALKEAKIPATFYMIGLHRYYGPQQEGLWKEVNSTPYFEVVNHSFTHGFKNQYKKYYNDLNGCVADINRNQDSLKFNNTIFRGPGSNAWRLPGISIDAKPNIGIRPQIMDSLYKQGYFVTGWDWEWEHYKNKAKQDAATLYNQIKNQFTNQKYLVKKNHLILLTHDAIFADTADAAQLRQFFAMVKADTTMELRTISQYPGAEGAFK